MNIKNNFTENFTDLFYKSNMTKRQLAIKIGVNHSTITNTLNGVLPTTNTIVKICDYFNCSIDYIVGLTDKFSYENSKTGFMVNAFYKEYENLLKINSTTHYALAKKQIVCETRLSSWKNGSLPTFEVLVKIAFELSGSVDKLLGRI